VPEPRRAAAHPDADRARGRLRDQPRPGGDAARQVAVRAREPLPVRHEPRLDVGRATGDARALGRGAALPAAALRRRARDGRARPRTRRRRSTATAGATTRASGPSRGTSATRTRGPRSAARSGCSTSRRATPGSRCGASRARS
jgi:hypothetical protein